MKTLITALIFAVSTSFAFAAGPTFAAADANGDGLVTMQEAKAALPNVEEATIVAADANNDGALTEDEYSQLTAG